jgi:hypothetical protein
MGGLCNDMNKGTSNGKSEIRDREGRSVCNMYVGLIMSEAITTSDAQVRGEVECWMEGDGGEN